ncbi:MAG: hypothetical protein ACLS70_04940 [[Clostridium] symbiosum]
MRFKNGKNCLTGFPFPSLKSGLNSASCIPSYEQYFPEVLEEIEGIAAGQKIDGKTYGRASKHVLHHAGRNAPVCAFKNENHIILPGTVIF